MKTAELTELSPRLMVRDSFWNCNLIYFVNSYISIVYSIDFYI